MKNKLIYFTIFVFALFLGVYGVSARVCNYENGVTLTFSKEEGSQIYNLTYSVDNKDKYTEIYNFVDPGVITNDDMCISSLYTCELNFVNGFDFKYLIPFYGTAKIIYNTFNYVDKSYFAIFGSSLDTQTINDAYANTFDAADESNWWTAYWTGRGVTCQTSDYIGDPIDSKNMVASCAKFNDLYDNISNAYKEYKKCGDLTGSNENKAKVSSCRSKALSNVNKATEDLSTVCNMIMGAYDSTDACISSCLNAVKSIEILKKKYIGVENFNNDCGFSDRLIAWINNILKWIKYILYNIYFLQDLIFLFYY